MRYILLKLIHVSAAQTGHLDSVAVSKGMPRGITWPLFIWHFLYMNRLETGTETRVYFPYLKCYFLPIFFMNRIPHPLNNPLCVTFFPHLLLILSAIFHFFCHEMHAVLSPIWDWGISWKSCEFQERNNSSSWRHLCLNAKTSSLRLSFAFSSAVALSSMPLALIK